MRFGSIVCIFLIILTTVIHCLFFVIIFPVWLLGSYLYSRDYKSLCLFDESVS